MSKKIVVTGGAGFIGSHVVDELVKKGHDVLVLDDYSGAYADDRFRNKHAWYMWHNISEAKKTLDEISRFKPDEVWHLAANAREGGSWFQPQNVVARNSFGLINVLEGAIRGGNLKKFIFFSSMSVYGNQQVPYTEDMEPKPDNPYAVSKYASERYIQLLSALYNFEWVIIRPHNVFGERTYRPDKFRNVIAIFTNQVLRGEPIYVYGNGSHRRAHSYIGDCIDPIMKAGEFLKNEIVNIGGDQDFSIQETADMVIEGMGLDSWPVEYLPDRYKEVPDAYCDHTKAHMFLDFSEKIGAKAGIARICEAFKREGPVDYVNSEPLTLSNEKIPKTWK